MRISSSMMSGEKIVLRELVTLFEENLSICDPFVILLYSKISRREIWVQKQGLYFMMMKFKVVNIREDTTVQDYQNYE